jgi:hypothetical protein
VRYLTNQRTVYCVPLNKERDQGCSSNQRNQSNQSKDGGLCSTKQRMGSGVFHQSEERVRYLTNLRTVDCVPLNKEWDPGGVPLIRERVRRLTNQRTG